MSYTYKVPKKTTWSRVLNGYNVLRNARVKGLYVTTYVQVIGVMLLSLSNTSLNLRMEARNNAYMKP